MQKNVSRSSTRRVFLSILRHSFAKIHSAFANPDDITEWVPVPGHPNADPLEYKELLGLEEMGETTVLIGKLKLRLDLRQLLDGYEARESRQQRQYRDRMGIHMPVNVEVNPVFQMGEGDNFGGDQIRGNKISGQ